MAAKQIAKPKPSEIPSRIRTLTLAGSCVVIAAFLGLRAASYVANLDSGEDKELLDRIRQLPGRTLVLIGPDDPTNLLLAIAKGGWVGWNFDRNGHYGHSLVQQLFPGIDFRLSNSIPDLDLVRDINLDDFDQVIEIADANTSIPATYSRGLRIENVNVSSVVPIGSRIKLLIFRKDSGA